MIREVHPLVASFCDIQPLSVSMINAVDYGKHYKRMVVNEFVKLVTVVRQGYSCPILCLGMFLSDLLTPRTSR